jgi:hypothetical protein
MKLSFDYLELCKILNEAGLTWRVKRALLKAKFNLDDEDVDKLIPNPPKGFEFPPEDY